jgi:hypothetical protein
MKGNCITFSELCEHIGQDRLKEINYWLKVFNGPSGAENWVVRPKFSSKEPKVTFLLKRELKEERRVRIVDTFKSLERDDLKIEFDIMER